MTTIRLLAALLLWFAIDAVVQFAPRSQRVRRVENGGPS